MNRYTITVSSNLLRLRAGSLTNLCRQNLITISKANVLYSGRIFDVDLCQTFNKCTSIHNQIQIKSCVWVWASPIFDSSNAGVQPHSYYFPHYIVIIWASVRIEWTTITNVLFFKFCAVFMILYSLQILSLKRWVITIKLLHKLHISSFKFVGWRPKLGLLFNMSFNNRFEQE